ncbi:cytochrome c oxidase subunit 3 family protein [bacterium]|nr:cytochrome c oxidase subunit 3 family protein [bacterium]
MSHATELPPGHFHHFEPETAYHASKFGMWLFLATEVLLFGGLFCAFAVFRWVYFDQFHAASTMLDWRLGALNTAVLLFSSYTMVLGVDAAQHGNNKKVVSCLNITVICALIFLVVKYFEYSAKIEHGLFPPKEIFFGLYFCMTGLHGLHVIAGMGLLLWVRSLAKKNLFSETYYTPVEVSGLYWHLVDMIWIFLFPLLYLVG